MMNTFFKPKGNVTRIPTPENFAHYVDNSLYQMKQHLNTSRLIIIGLLFSQLISGIVLAGLWNFCVQTGAKVEGYELVKEGTFKDGNIELAPIEIIGGGNAK